MATGILGQAAPAATTNTVIYTVPASTVTVATISIVNTTLTSIAVRLAIASGTPTTSEYIEYDTIISASGVLERSGIVMNATEAVVVFSSAVGLAVSVYGYEEV